MGLARAAAGRLPLRWQQFLKRYHFSLQIHRGTFNPGEPEFDYLDRWVGESDWVVDLGANVGHYTLRLAEIAKFGRVVALEPVPETFELLCANVAGLDNVTLLNVAASDESRLCSMNVPRTASRGTANYYEARLSERHSENRVMTIAVDQLEIPNRVSLVKLDVEGHELATLRGMDRLIRRDAPILVVEGASSDVERFLAEREYIFDSMRGSPNRVYFPVPADHPWKAA